MNEINVFDKIVIEKQITIENMEIEDFFYINLHLVDGLGMEFTAC